MMDKCLLCNAGFINYYKYKDHIFNFHSNNIIFRGDNGAGKSLTAGSLFPNIFTMNDSKSLNLGGKSRVKDISYCLHNNEESYIWLMFKTNNVYHTLVIGYYMKGDKRINRRGFIMKDNVKFNDISFFSDGDDKELLSLSSFRANNKELIEFYTDTSVGYREAINNKFYKFPTLEDYDYFVDSCSLLTRVENIKEMSKNNSKIDRLYLEKILMQALPDAKSSIRNQLFDFINTVKSLKEAKIHAEQSKENVENIIQLENLTEQRNLPLFARITNNSIKIDNNFEQTRKELKSKKRKLEQTQKEYKEISNELDKIQIDESKTKNRIKILEKLIEDSDYKELSEKCIEKKEELSKLKRIINDNAIKLSKNKEELNEQKRELEKSIERLEIIDSNINDLYDIKDFLWDYKSENNLKLAIDKQVSLINSIKSINNEIALQGNRVSTFQKEYDSKTIQQNDLLNDLSLQQDKLNKEYRKWFEDIDIDVPLDLEFDEMIDESLYDKHIEDRKKSLEKPLFSLQYSKSSIEKDLSDLEEELNFYKKETTLDKQAVFEDGIQLYEVIDFKDKIDENFKFKIEASLTYSKLLFTVFDPSGVSESLIFNERNSNKKYDKNLLNLFDIREDLSPELRKDIFQFLSCISYDDNGNISTDVVSSISNNIKNSVIYIGEDNRKRERERKIKEIEGFISKKRTALSDINDKIVFSKQELENFKNIVKSKPNITIYLNLKNKLDLIRKDLSDIEHSIQKELEILKSKKEEKELKIKDFDEKLPDKIELLYEIKQRLGSYVNLLEKKNHEEKFKAFYENNVVEKEKDIKSTKDDLSQLNNDEKILEGLIENIENELKKDTSYANNVEEISLLKTKLKELYDLENNTRTEFGKFEERLDNLQVEVENINVVFDTNKKIKNAKEELIEKYKIPMVKKQVDDFNDAKKIWDIINHINANKSDFIYKIGLNPLVVKEEISYTGELSNIVNDIKNIYNVTYKSLDDVTVPKNNAITSIKADVERYTAVYNEQRGYLETQLFAEGIFEPMAEVIDKAERIATDISNTMTKNFRPDKTSIKATFKTSDNVPYASAKRKLLKGELERSNPNREKIIERLVDIVNNNIDENFNISDEEIVDVLYEELDYKQLYTFTLSFYKKNERNWEKIGKNLDDAGGSKGENIRAIFEIYFAIVSASIEKAELKDSMPRLVVLDEAFEGVAPEETKRLEGLMKDVFNIFIAASYTYMVKSNWDVDYITIEDCSSKDTPMLYIDTMLISQSKNGDNVEQI